MEALVVDDDQAVRAFLCRLLGREGWSAQACQTVDEALAAAKSGTFRLAFVDVHVGSGDGIELAKSLRSMQPKLSVILMSGSSTHEERARRVGMEPILLKPVSVETVCALLGACDGDGERP